MCVCFPTVSTNRLRPPPAFPPERSLLPRAGPAPKSCYSRKGEAVTGPSISPCEEHPLQTESGTRAPVSDLLRSLNSCKHPSQGLWESDPVPTLPQTVSIPREEGGNLCSAPSGPPWAGCVPLLSLLDWYLAAFSTDEGTMRVQSPKATQPVPGRAWVPAQTPLPETLLPRSREAKLPPWPRLPHLTSGSLPALPF